MKNKKYPAERRRKVYELARQNGSPRTQAERYRDIRTSALLRFMILTPEQAAEVAALD